MSLESIEEKLTEISKQLSQQTHDFVITMNTCDQTVYFEQPLNIKNGKVAFKLLSTYYSIPNIKPANNIFRYQTMLNQPFRNIELETGAWELSAIADFLKDSFDYEKRTEYVLTNMVSKHNEHDSVVPVDEKSKNNMDYIDLPVIKLSAQVSTMKSILEIPENHSVDFESDNTFGKLLGFKSQIYGQGRHISENIVDINPVNTIHVHCDIVDGAMINGEPSKCVHTFEPRTAPGHKIVVEPKNLVYYPVFHLETISKLRVWLTDDIGNVIDNRGEKVTIVLSFKI